MQLVLVNVQRVAIAACCFFKKKFTAKYIDNITAW